MLKNKQIITERGLDIMFKKILGVFGINKRKDSLRSNPKEEGKNALEQEVGKAIDEIKDEIFTVDFISIRENNETIKNAEVVFPAKNQYIIINGEKTYFDAYYVRDEGKSSDNLYNRIATPDFKFWILPKDYKRFMVIANHRHDILIENRKKRDEIIKIDMNTPCEYDSIDKDIYKCFISNKAGMCDAIGTWEQFRKVEEQIAKICEENSGRYFKTQAKTANFAIIFDYIARTYSNVSSLKEKGYKVTTFEKALEFFGLSHMWNLSNLKKMEKKHKEFIKESYNK